MARVDYSYKFGDIVANRTEGWVSMDVEIEEPGLMKHQQGFAQVTVRDSNFLRRSTDRVPPELADCVDVAVSVHVADRLTLRSEQTQPTVHIKLPVRQPDLWNDPSVLQRLQKALYWYTRETWTFEFTQRSSWPRRSELQFSLPTAGSPVEVALWSGGLDAFVGLLNRMYALDSSIRSEVTSFTLFGTGSDPYIQGRQKSLADAVEGLAPGRTKFIQVPVAVTKGEVALHRDSSQRTRGFVFLLLGAVCAQLEGQHSLHVYENGPGGINLRFHRSEIGRDHAVAVHPISLLYMSDLVSQATGQRFAYFNPFIGYTKAQMCQVLNEEAAAYLAHAFRTVSCDSLRRQRPRQCGVCSSCLLRRQALLAAGIQDGTRYAVLANMHSDERLPGRVRKAFDSTHLLAMEHQVDVLSGILASRDDTSAWNGLVDEYSILQRIVDETALADGRTDVVSEEQLVRLYRRYTGEWQLPGVRETLAMGLKLPSRVSVNTRA